MDTGERRVIFAETVDLNESDAKQDDSQNQIVPNDSEEDIADDVPVKKARRFGTEEIMNAKQELMLTRSFQLESEYGAAYTGGTFLLMKDGQYGLALKDEKVNLVHIDTTRVVGTLQEENEAVITFTVSPN